MPVTRRFEFRLPPSPVAPSTARGALSPLEEVVEPEVLDSVRLLVSELVTNAVRHARLRGQDRIHLRVEAGDDSVRVDVSDPGPGFLPAEQSPRPEDSFGWGLYLVGEIADRWGVERSDRTMVWFEIDRRHPQGRDAH
jgi:anti-sigma regulatory factor (Ser/Thr protein kinase)